MVRTFRPIRVVCAGLAAALALATLAAPSARGQCDDETVARQGVGAPMVPVSTPLGVHCDDCSALVAFPFPVTFYGRSYSSAWITSNGTVQFDNSAATQPTGCIPSHNLETTIAAMWTDLTTNSPGDGVFVGGAGLAPNREFTIEWRAHYFSQPGTANFQVKFYEGSRNFDVIYGNVTPANIVTGCQKGRGELSYAVDCAGVTFAPAANTRITWSSEAPSTYVNYVHTGHDFPVGTTDIGNHCDDCVTHVNLPFPVPYYGNSYSSINVSSNGNVQFQTASGAYQNQSLPQAFMGPALFPLWDDLRTDLAGGGIFTSVGGNAPSRFFNIEWRANVLSTGAAIHFGLRLFEGLEYSEYYYDVIPQGGSSATVGAQAGDERFREEWSNPGTSTIDNGTMLSVSLGPTRVISAAVSAGGAGSDIGNHCDDCTTPLAIPFPVTIFGQQYSSANVSSNGTLQFATANPAFSNVCLPAADMGPTVFAHWDDLRTDTPGSGVTAQVYGSAPNRDMVITWNATYFNNANSHVKFEVVLWEGRPNISLYMDQIDQYGASATIGVQDATGTIVRQYSCSSPGRAPAWVEFKCLTPNLCDPDLNQDGNIDQDDVAYLINVIGGGANPANIDPDFNHDGNADQDDVLALINVIAGGLCP